jgi:hypothetical protein
VSVCVCVYECTGLRKGMEQDGMYTNTRKTHPTILEVQHSSKRAIWGQTWVAVTAVSLMSLVTSRQLSFFTSELWLSNLKNRTITALAYLDNCENSMRRNYAKHLLCHRAHCQYLRINTVVSSECLPWTEGCFRDFLVLIHFNLKQPFKVGTIDKEMDTKFL